MTPPGVPVLDYFPEPGTWRKDPRAAAVDVVVCAGGGGACFQYFQPGADAGIGRGEDGGLTVTRLYAGALPDTMEVTVGKGGRPGGRDGYVLVITHLAEPDVAAAVVTPVTCHACGQDVW